MKKFIAILCALALVASLAACGAKNETPVEPETSKNPVEDLSLSEIAAGMLEGVEDLPMVGDVELNAENFESFAFIPYVEGYEGLVSEAMIGSIAHSVVLVRVPAEVDASKVAEEIDQAANPRKWICVEAEKTVVRQYGNTIALVMSFTQTANQIISNFDALNGSETPAEDQYDPNAVPQIPDEMLPEDEIPLGEPAAPAGGEVEEPTEEPKPAVKPEEKPATKPTEEKPAVKPEEKPTEEKPSEEKPVVKPATDLSATMAKILEGAPDLPKVGDTPLTSENFSFYSFIDYVDGYQGLASDAMIGSIAHSVVLVEVPEGTDVSKVAASIKANADPRKWICVEAEKTQVATKGNLIVLVMSSTENTDKIVENFNAL